MPVGGTQSFSQRAVNALSSPRAPFVAGGILTALPRVWLALTDHSVFWPDEIYQSVEPAHRIAFGYGLISWEFRDGARSWFLPGVLSAVMKIASLFSGNSLVVVGAVKLFMVALAVCGTLAAVAYAERLAGRAGAWLAGALASVLPPLLVFSHRATPEMASAPLLVIGALGLLGPGPIKAYAGPAVGTAIALRMQTAPIAAILCLELLRVKKYSDAARFVTGIGWCLMLAGALDWVTWGHPFNSVVEYMRFTLKGGANTFGVLPASYYFYTLWTACGPILLLVVAGLVLALPKARHTVVAIIVFVGLHVLIPHKEFRFLGPAIPLACAVAAVGLARGLAALSAPWGVQLATGLVAILAGGVQAARLTNGDLGMYLGQPFGAASVWRFGQNATMLIAAAGRRPDLCGLVTLGLRAGFTGGYSYLHRDVPLLYRHDLCDEPKSANYLIAREGRKVPEGYALVDRRGEQLLYRRAGSCTAPENYDFMLEGANDMGIYRAPIDQPDPAELRINAGRNGSAFTQGWGNGERQSCRGVRWAAAKSAEVKFPLVPAGGAYTLSFTAMAFAPAMPQTARVLLNDREVGRYPLTNSWAGYQALVPPDRLVRGPNRLVFEFSKTEHPGGNDERELAALFSDIGVAPAASVAQIDVGTPAGRGFLTSGFSTDENAGGRNYAWSDGPRSKITVALAGAGGDYVLRVHAQAYAPGAPQLVGVKLNDRLVGKLEIPASWTRRALLLPAGLVQPGQNALEFEYSSTHRPSEQGNGSTDERELAAMFDEIQIAPLPAANTIDFGTRGAHAHVFAGFSGDERDGVRTAVWSDGPSSIFAIAVQSVDGPQHLRFVTRAFAPLAGSRVNVLANGTEIGHFEPDETWQALGVTVPARVLHAGANVFELRYARTARPADTIPGSKDRRELAIQLDSVKVVDLSNSGEEDGQSPDESEQL